MELKNICDKLIEFFEIKDVGELGQVLYDKMLFTPNQTKFFDEYVGIVKNLETDWIQKIFQYYKSNRDDLKQDYTPKCLSNLLARLSNYKEAKTVLDVCCGSGSLMIELHKQNPNLEFYGIELDENVIPFLLFNLSLHNITATIYVGDVIEDIGYKIIKLKSTDKYSIITKITNIPDGFELSKHIHHYDIIVSNPPYHLKLSGIKRVGDKPVQKSSEYFFLLFYLKHLNVGGKCSVIFPSGFLTSSNKEDFFIRKYLIENDMLISAIVNPPNMFESTATSTCILNITTPGLCGKKVYVNNFLLIDSTENKDIWIREQRGQFGGKAHTNRVYKKSFNTYNEDNIRKILEATNKYLELTKKNKHEYDFSIVVNEYDLQEKNYSLSAGQYFEAIQEYYDITQEEYIDFIKNNLSFDLTDLFSLTESLSSEYDTKGLKYYIDKTNETYSFLKETLLNAKVKSKEEIARENNCSVEELVFKPWQ